jgi:HSP20 family protein
MSLHFPRFHEQSPFFRLTEELDRSARLGGSLQGETRSFAPRFDVKETKETYELHGELPGIEKSNVNIEWTDDSALTVSGHTERTYESTDEPKGEEGTVQAGEQDQAVTKTNQNTAVTKTDEPRPRYWVSERSYGSFHRSFQFPTAVDHEKVQASLTNGILKIIVPKAKPREPRKIAIQS